VLKRRRSIAGLFNSETWLRSQTGRVLSGLALAAIAPDVADAARKDERRTDAQDHNNNDAGNSRGRSEERNQSDTESNRQNDGASSAESRDTSAKSNDSDKHVRNDSPNGTDDSRQHGATDSGKTRNDAGHNAASDSNSSNSSTDDNDSHHHGGRHALGFEQKAGNSTGDSSADSSPTDSSSPNNVPDATSVTPANPNVAVDHVPDTSSLNDLVVQGNDHVLASVSTSGGFAFARSGDVIAVSGPDGASIIQSGDVNTGTSGTNPATPSDSGGNNNTDFAS